MYKGEPNNISISEILTKASKIKSTNERIEYIQNHKRSAGVMQVLRFAFHPDWKTDLPKGKTPYKPYPEVGAEAMLYSDLRRLYLFVDNEKIGNPNLSSKKREFLWIGFLENLDAKDAEMMDLAKNGNLKKKFPYFTEKFAEKAFPEAFEEKKENDEVSE